MSTEENVVAVNVTSSKSRAINHWLRTIFLNLSDFMWGEKARPGYLIIAAVIIISTMLGARELWTQEWRWANISWYMIYTKDYLHPYLAGVAYYDKPLLSYWLMIISSHYLGGLNEFSLRFPPALAGILVVVCCYRLGDFLVNRSVGLIAGWMLISTYYFVFWSRTANADMLNLSGIMLAVLWYFLHRNKPRFANYLWFFLILAITALFKGLIGVVVPLLVILPDLLVENRWKKHLRLDVLLALILPLILYLAPFWASDHSGATNYGESGLHEVYRENILRYFHPFDHQGPIYTYLIYLPIYMLPWAFFLFPAIASIPKRWHEMQWGARWMCWSTLLVFLFLTISGSRRSYYVLPLVPFATMMTAEWLAHVIQTSRKYSQGLAYFVFGSLSGIFLLFAVILPLYYANGGLRPFAANVVQQAELVHPWASWNIVFLDAESKLTLYLQPDRPIVLLDPPGKLGNETVRENASSQVLAQQWPIIAKPHANTIFITRKMYVSRLQPYFTNYQLIYSRPNMGLRLLHIHDEDLPVAFIPKS